MFAYDNGTFVVESFRDAPETVTIVANGLGRKVMDLSTGQPAALVAGAAAAPPTPLSPARRARPAPQETRFTVTIAPHSYQVFRLEN
jgi:hypothetical protein